MRNFNNWIKSVLITEFIKKIKSENQIQSPSVLDLGCGRGGDILKWKKANVSRVTFADIADKSLDECKSRYTTPNRANFDAEFVNLDATKELIKDKIGNLEHDLVSSQFVLHYSFESFEQANTFLKNVSDSLKPGGYFIGTTTNANELIKRLRDSDSNCFGNEIYKIKFYQEEKTNFDLFGVKFDFQLENVVECPEFLVNFKALVRIAEKHGLKLLFKKPFDEFFSDYCENSDYKYLITVMQALEPYFPKDLADDESNRIEGDYEFIESKLQDEEFKKSIRQNETYATLSQSEWDAITLYLCFAFVKVDKSVDKLDTQNEKDEESDGEDDDKEQHGELSHSVTNKRKLDESHDEDHGEKDKEEEEEEEDYEPVTKKTSSSS